MIPSYVLNRDSTLGHGSYLSSNGPNRGRRRGVRKGVVTALVFLSIIDPLLSSFRQIEFSLIQGQHTIRSSSGSNFGFGLGVVAAPIIESGTILKRQDSAPTDEPIDPCETLGELVEPYISYGHVKRCYENVPYNATEANVVVSTMFTLVQDFYIFLDSATTSDLAKPFTSPPVDVLEGFDQISRTDYASDFKFQTDVDLLMNRLNDAHANYIAHCYRHYLFEQPLDLYAPVIDKVQTIRILRDKSANLLDDCQVVAIDGVNAIDAIQTWVDINFGFSKDAGVRFNRALTHQIYSSAEKKWVYDAGQFTSRVTLPERPEVVYDIHCPVSPLHPEEKNYTLKAPWEVYRLVSWNEFDGTESFLRQNCYRDTDPALQKEEEDLIVIEDSATVPANIRRTKRMERASRRPENLYQAAVETPRHLILQPKLKSATPPFEKRQRFEIPIAHLVSNGSSTAFYQLVKRPTIGVVIIPTHSVSLRLEAHVLENGFAQLYEAGVRNVILDLTSNGGGYVNFAYDLVDWMFPQENVTSVYVSDLRTSMGVKAIASKDLDWEDYNSYFNPASYSDVLTGKEFETNFFLEDKLIRRVNRQLDYSPKVRMNHRLGAFERGMPWQHDPDRIVVLTDGSCGSACGMSLNRLKNRHGVKSYAVGGRHGEDLSLFSFAGASVYTLDEILEDYDELEVDPPMQQMRYKGIYRVPVMEFFDDDETKPIEFRPELYKADFHLDYTPTTARRHELLWEIVANNHWTPEGQSGDDPSIE
ncbi:hypothetical protein FBU30_003807 [Linnemannia zychae]|nr:hypothetical protein FBU30_003807 [Linnemannia zychae]